MKSHRQSVQINFINVICNYVFHATCVNTTVCSYIFISLFTSLSLCCLHLLFAVFLEELAEVWTTLHFSAFKITLSVRPLKNKNTELKKTVYDENKTFFTLLLLRYQGWIQDFE